MPRRRDFQGELLRPKDDFLPVAYHHTQLVGIEQRVMEDSRYRTLVLDVEDLTLSCQQQYSHSCWQLVDHA